MVDVEGEAELWTTLKSFWVISFAFSLSCYLSDLSFFIHLIKLLVVYSHCRWRPKSHVNSFLSWKSWLPTLAPRRSLFETWVVFMNLFKYWVLSLRSNSRCRNDYLRRKTFTLINRNMSWKKNRPLFFF